MKNLPSWARSPVTVAIALLVVLFVVWRLIDAMPIDDETKEAFKRRFLQGILIAIAAAFAVPALLGLPWFYAAGAAAAALAATGALEVAQRAAGDATGARPVECGDPGTWGQVIDGAVCLFIEPEESENEEL